MSTSHYGTRDVAAQCGLSLYMVGRYFRAKNPTREPKSQTRLDESEFQAAVSELQQCLEACPLQPLHALTRKQQGREMVASEPVYTAFDLALAVGVCTGTARNYLRWRYPRHEPESWWRLDNGEFVEAKAHLLELKAKRPKRPLYGLQTNLHGVHPNGATS